MNVFKKATLVVKRMSFNRNNCKFFVYERKLAPTKLDLPYCPDFQFKGPKLNLSYS
jgi:hypothetical protein